MKVDWHRELLFVPSAIGAALFAHGPLDSNWLAFPFILIALWLYRMPYEAYFSASVLNPRRREFALGVLFVVLAQVLLWAGGLWLAHTWMHPVI